MLVLSNCISLPSIDFVEDFQLTSVTGLKAWYKFNTGITLDTNSGTETVVLQWADSSGNTDKDMDLTLATSLTENVANYSSSTGGIEFRSSDKSILNTDSDQLNLGAFTIFGVIDIVESGAANEAILGRLGNDELRFYRGSSASGFRARINGANKDINLDSNLPNDKLLFTVIRASNGTISVRINGTTQSNTSSLAITNLFDFLRIGNASTDSDVYEIAIYDNEVSADNITLIENNINIRNNIN